MQNHDWTQSWSHNFLQRVFNLRLFHKHMVRGPSSLHRSLTNPLTSKHYTEIDLQIPIEVLKLRKSIRYGPHSSPQMSKAIGTYSPFRRIIQQTSTRLSNLNEDVWGNWRNCEIQKLINSSQLLVSGRAKTFTKFYGKNYHSVGTDDIGD